MSPSAVTNPELPNFPLIGSCFDILHVDPLHLAGGTDDIATAPPIVQVFTFADDVNVPGTEFSAPPIYRVQGDDGGHDSSSTTEITTESDFKQFVKDTGSLSVSDPTGQLFAGKLSGSTTSARQFTQNSKTVLSYSIREVTKFWLVVDLDTPGLELNPEVQFAMQGLPTEASGAAAYDDFIKRHGTHFMIKALFGGRAIQRSSISTTDYVTCLESGVSVNAEAKATFEAFKTEASASHESTISSVYKNASSLKIEDIDFIGGTTTQEFLDMWAMGVPQRPMPIRGSFEPISSLYDHELLFFPEGGAADDDLADLQKRKALLDAAVTRHLEAGGGPATSTGLTIGASVTLRLADAGADRFLTGGVFCSTPNASHSAGAGAIWTLSDPTGAAAAGAPVKTGSPVVLVNVATGQVLSANSGEDADYDRGDGLTGLTKDTTSPASQWRFAIATLTARDTVASGDIVRIDAVWVDRSGRPGCLAGEPSTDDDAQRVYGFGRPGKPATTWVVNAVPA